MKDERHSFQVRVLRQQGPGEPSYWERFQVVQQPDMNVISVLQAIAASPVTAEGRPVAPVAWDCNCLEEVCGACTMVINGQVRQACSALVPKLLADNPEEIELRPASKFPVVRDLFVDRSRLFHALERIEGWVHVDTYGDMGPGLRQSPKQQEEAYPLSKCMSCGCCLEACPQYVHVELVQLADETDEHFAKRKSEAHGRAFIGAHAISQAVLFNTNPTEMLRGTDGRWEKLEGPGGIQVCGNAQNCVAVCPKEIPLTRSIAQAGRATTVHAIKSWFDR